MSVIDARRGKMFSRSSPSQRLTPINSVGDDKLVFAPADALDVIGDRDAPPWLIVIARLPIAHQDSLHGNLPITVLHQEALTGEILQLTEGLSPTGARSTSATRQSHGTPLEPLRAGSADVDDVVLCALMLRRVDPIDDDEAGWAPSGDTGSSMVIHPQRFPQIIVMPYLVIATCMIGVHRDLPEAIRAGCDAAERAE